MNESLPTEGTPLTREVLLAAMERLRNPPPLEPHVHVVHPLPIERGDAYVLCFSCGAYLDRSLIDWTDGRDPQSVPS